MVSLDAQRSNASSNMRCAQEGGIQRSQKAQTCRSVINFENGDLVKIPFADRNLPWRVCAPVQCHLYGLSIYSKPSKGSA